jgi:penicillin-binding protein 1C
MGRTLINYSKRQRYYQNDFRQASYLKDQLEKKGKALHTNSLSAGSIWTTFNCMTELARPEAYSGGTTFSTLHKIAWKTGTSFGYRDAWAVGVNQKYTIVVWVGNADGEGRPGLTGINVAAPLLFSLFNVLPSAVWFQKPAQDLTEVKTCAETGYRWTENCPDYKIIEAPLQTRSSQACMFHKLVLCDSTGQHQVNSQCYPVVKMQKKPYLVLTPLQEFFYRQKHLEFTARPPYLPRCIDESTEAAFDIIYPRNAYKIYLPVNENNQRNELILNATHNRKNAKLFWYLDKNYIGSTLFYHQLSIVPDKGQHELVVTEEHGKSIQIFFEIIDKWKSK